MNTVRTRLASLGIGPDIDILTLLSLFGIWTQHTWVLWANTSNTALPSWLPWQALYAVLAAVMLGVAGATLWREKHAGKGGEREGTDGSRGAGPQAAGNRQGAGLRVACHHRGTPDLALALLGCAATLAMGFARLLPCPAAWSAGGLAVGTACYAWAYIRWGEVYQRLTLQQAILLLFGGAMAADVVKMVMTLLPELPCALLAACLPVLSCLMAARCLRWVAGERGGEPGPHAAGAAGATGAAPATSTSRIHYTRSNIGALWRVAGVFVAFSLVNSMMLALFHPAESAGVGSTLLGRLLDLALCAALLAYVFKFHGKFDFSQLWSAVLILLATDLLAYVLAPGTDLPRFFATASLNFIVLFVWLALADIAHHSDIHPHVIFGVGWSLYALPLFLGTFASAWLGAGGQGAVYAAVLLYVICLTTTLFLDARNQDTKYVFRDLLPEQPTSPRDFADIDGRCALVASRFGLTSRELEIMQMLCKGRSKAYIAETLFITENTVKSHTKRMYAKLDVHNRRELQELIEA